MRQLLGRTNIEHIFSTVESLGKRPLQQLADQHHMDVRGGYNDVDDIRTELVDHLLSGSCEASGSGLCAFVRDEVRNTAYSDLETHILGFAAKKGSIHKKTLRCILKCRNVEFSEDDGIGCLRK